MTKNEIEQWAESTQCELEVAWAIFSIATDERTMDEIWALPSDQEVNLVKTFIKKYDDNINENGYCWGQEIIFV